MVQVQGAVRANTRWVFGWWVFGWMGVAMIGCAVGGNSAPLDAGPGRDAAFPPDTGTRLDAALRDAAPDGAFPDAGSDAARPDAGLDTSDAGFDAGRDTGTVDLADAARPDAGSDGGTGDICDGTGDACLSDRDCDTGLRCAFEATRTGVCIRQLGVTCSGMLRCSTRTFPHCAGSVCVSDTERACLCAGSGSAVFPSLCRSRAPVDE
ncbi:MAG: hypothetical protein AAGE52_06510 [Myxococcota bacterium]